MHVCGLSGGFWGDLDVEAQGLQTPCHLVDGALLVEVVEIICPQVLIFVARQDMISGDQDLVGDGDMRTHLTAAGAQATAFLGQIAASCLRDGNRASHQGRLQMHVALADLAAALLATTLMATAQPTPVWLSY